MRDTSRDVVIVGVSARFPGTQDINSWWNSLLKGEILTTRYSYEELEKNGILKAHYLQKDYIPVRGHLDNILRFDNQFFNLNNRDAEIMDPQYRLMLEASWCALEDAGYGKKNNRPVTGVFASCSTSSYMYNILFNGPYEPDILEQIIHGNEKDFIASIIAYKLNLIGPAISIQTACSSSLVGLHLAKQSLLNKECDLALVAAAAVPFPQGGYLYHDGGIYSKNGKCRPFDANADGVIEGSGVACVILKRLEDVNENDVEPYAVILGSAINNDGSSKVGYFAPSITGQKRVIKQAIHNANIDISKVSYIEMHGTGTVIGDPIEWTSTSECYQELGAKTNQIAIGSVKANVGHLDAAAGLASLIKTVMILRTNQIPPLANFDVPNPYLSNYDSSPLYIPNDISNNITPYSVEIAAINSFGIGGTNAHVVIGKMPNLNLIQKTIVNNSKPKLYTLSFSANDTASLDRVRQSMIEYLINNSSNLDDVAYSLREGRERFKKLLTVFGYDKQEIINKLSTDDKNLFYSESVNASFSTLVFLFPGQGTQYPGMAIPFLVIPELRETIESCIALCDFNVQQNIRDSLFNPFYPKEKLDETELTQPSLFILEYSISKCLMNIGLTPAIVLGHSLGELTAMCISGVLTLQHALKLVTIRGKSMQQCNEGLMLNLDLSEKELKEVILRLGSKVSIAALNTENSSVISGTKEDIIVLQDFLGDKAVSKILKSNRAFHSELISEALPFMSKVLKEISISPAKIPIICNLDGMILDIEHKVSSQYFLNQAISTVQFKKSLEQLKNFSNVFCIEVGPGKVLGSMSKTYGFNTISLANQGSKTKSDDVLQQLMCIDSIGFHIKLFNYTKGKMLHIPTYKFYGPKWIAPEINLSNTEKLPNESSVLNTNNKSTTDLLIAIWNEVLRCNNINTKSNFFLLGGDSLMITSIIRKVNKTFNINVPAKDMLSCQTLEDQVNIIEKSLNIKSDI